MTDNNSDQDDFDPSQEEGAEDFGYEEESFGDEEFSDEPWDENFEEGGDEAAHDDKHTQTAKKKGGLFNVILIAAAVLGGGAFIYLKVLAPSGGSVPLPTPIAEAPAEMPAETQQASVLPPEAPAALSSLTPDPVAPPAPEPTLASEPAPAPVLELTPEPAPTPVPEPTPVLAEAPAPEIAPIAPVVPEPQQPVEVATAPPMPSSPIAAPATPEAVTKTDNDFNPGLPSAKDIMLAPTAAPGENAAPAGGISADAAKGIEQKLSVLLARLDTFEGRITNLEAGLHQVSSKISALESKPAAVADLEGVNNTLQALERKVSGLEKTASSAPAPEPDVSKIDKPTFVPAVPETKEPPPKTVSAIDTPKVETASKPVVKAEPTATAARNVSWVLRSAQPGAAMVAPKAGGDMRAVRVGDNLSGLGRIIAIEQRGSRWVVQGTQGTLTH